MRRPMSRSAAGFTLVEVLTVVAILVLLISILVPSLSRVRAYAYRAKCKSNLRELTRACITYANAGRFHRGTSAYALPSNGPSSGNWGDMSSGNPGALWLLVTTNIAPNKDLFLCPHARVGGILKAPAKDATGFTENTYSYSYLSQVPFEFDGKTYNSTSIGEQASISLPILADRNPRCTPGTRDIDTSQDGKNSTNHEREGQNVGRLDQSVTWNTSPEVDGDDVYRPASGAGDDGERKNPDDGFLIP